MQSRQDQIGARQTSEHRGPRYATRRRTVIVLILTALVGLAFAANYGPLRHYVDARSRWAQRTAEVAALESENTAKQAQLSKLLQPGYLEELARKQLTYALPNEQLFIVTGTDQAAQNSTVTPGLGVGGIMSGTDTVNTVGSGVPGDSGTVFSGSQSTAGTSGASGKSQHSGDSGVAVVGGDGPGFLERLLTRIADIF